MAYNYGGINSSFSYAYVHGDLIPNSLVAVVCPALMCEWVMFQNDPDSTGTIFLGSPRLAVVGTGIELAAGETTGWIPANNLNLFTHKETDATTYLRYMVIQHGQPQPDPVILIEISRSPLLLEDRSRINIYG